MRETRPPTLSLSPRNTVAPSYLFVPQKYSSSLLSLPPPENQQFPPFSLSPLVLHPASPTLSLSKKSTTHPPSLSQKHSSRPPPPSRPSSSSALSLSPLALHPVVHHSTPYLHSKNPLLQIPTLQPAPSFFLTLPRSLPEKYSLSLSHLFAPAPPPSPHLQQPAPASLSHPFTPQDPAPLTLSLLKTPQQPHPSPSPPKTSRCPISLDFQQKTIFLFFLSLLLPLSQFENPTAPTLSPPPNSSTVSLSPSSSSTNRRAAASLSPSPRSTNRRAIPPSLLAVAPLSLHPNSFPHSSQISPPLSFSNFSKKYKIPTSRI